MSDFIELDTLLQTKGITLGGDFQKVCIRASQIERYRSRHKGANRPDTRNPHEVSHSSLFVACCEVSNLWSGLQKLQIRRDLFLQRIFGLPEEDDESTAQLEALAGSNGTPATLPIAVMPSMDRALSDLAKQGPLKPNAGAVLALACIVAGGTLPNLLKSADADLGLLITSLEGLALESDMPDPTERNDWGTVRLAPHVERALWRGAEISGDAVLDARNAVLGILSLSPNMTSEAFTWIRKQFHRLAPPDVATQSSPIDLAKVTLSAELARSRARLRTQTGEELWGRDYISIILLSDDPTLNRVCEEASIAKGRLRNEWYRFLEKSRKRPGGPSWAEWWAVMNKTPPSTTAAQQAANDSEAASIGEKAAPNPTAETAEATEDVTYLTTESGDTLATEDGSRLVVGDESPRQTELGSSPDPKGGGAATRPLSLTVPQAGASGITTDRVSLARTAHSPEDSLNQKTQATVFASLTLSEEVSPPFAIGLLGDWGVGKSFFMSLIHEQISNHIEATKTKPRLGTIGRAAQIEFNAWHYADTDLWASLASHIFESLAAELCNQEEPLAKVRRELRARINSNEKERQRTGDSIRVLEASRQEAVDELARLEPERERREHELRKLKLGRVWRALKSANNEEGSLFQRALSEAESVLTDLGMAQTISSAQDLEKARVELAETQDRAKNLFASIAYGYSGGRAFWPLAIVGLGALLLHYWEALTSGPLRSVEWLQGQGFTALVLELSGGIALLAKHANALRKRASTALDKLEEAHQILLAPGDTELTELTERELGIKNQLKALETSITHQRTRMGATESQIAQAQKELAHINSGGLVYDFLGNKRADSQYNDRLGIISIIRRDFEHLGTLLEDWAKHDVSRERRKQFHEQKEKEGGDSASLPAPSENEERARDERPVERIVLYIDDLDRCEPERVVEVLQAVHLLLAFDLFIVVVAVDARWLERSLNEAYRSDEKFGDEFKPDNYLEKIFQIPYALPRMNQDGFEKLVTQLAKPPKRTEAGEESDAENGEGKGEPLQNRPKEENSKTTSQEEQGETEAQAPCPPQDAPRETGSGSASRNFSGKPAAEGKEKAEVEAPSPEDEEEERANEEARQAAEQRQQAMALTSDEAQFIRALHPFIGTPRATRRFLNIYRLIRVRVAMDEAGGSTSALTFAQFQEEYPVVLLSLAICVGEARFGPTFFEELQLEAGGPLLPPAARGVSEWLIQRSALSASFTAPLRHRLEQLGSNPGVDEDFARVQTKVAAVRRHLLREQSPDSQASAWNASLEALDAYARWAPYVTRFSFHFGQHRSEKA